MGGKDDSQIQNLDRDRLSSSDNKKSKRTKTSKYKQLKRILILDWDVHHGNGTQEITYNDEHILFISLHRSDKSHFYPSKSNEMGSENLGGEKAKGLNINIPFNNYHYDYFKDSYDIFDVDEEPNCCGNGKTTEFGPNISKSGVDTDINNNSIKTE